MLTGRVNFDQKVSPNYTLHKTGALSLNSNNGSNNNLNANTNLRVASTRVNFSSHFDDEPIVVTALAMVDILVEADAYASVT
jgi:hypothetical protein